MRLSWKLGRVAGIDLFLHPTFLILLAVVGLSGGAGLPAVALVLATFGCVLLHELGHALMARRFGIPTVDITLYPIGGVARLLRLPKAPGAELLIALAGPAVNVGIALVLGALLVLLDGIPGASASQGFLSDLLMVNVLLFLFNLLPAFPMDGGRVVRALLSIPMGRSRATEVAAVLGQVLALALPLMLIVLGLFSWFHLILAGFIFTAAGAELAQVRAEERRRTAGPALEDPGVWTAPPGYYWASQGNGVWQLAPIVVTAAPVRPHRSWR